MEIEVDLFARQCVGKRRIPDLKTLRRKSRAWNHRANCDRIQINWKFDRRAARKKFGYKKHFSKRSENYGLAEQVGPFGVSAALHDASAMWQG